MAEQLAVVTGIRELDAKLRTLAPAIQRKFVRGALRRGSKRVVQDANRIIRNEAYQFGVLYRSLKPKSLKRSRTRIGIAIFQDRDKIMADYKSKYGHEPHPAKGRSDPFYYPAAIEYGTDTTPKVAPMRRSLYENEKELRAYFEQDVRQFINENKVTVTLPKQSRVYRGQ